MFSSIRSISCTSYLSTLLAFLLRDDVLVKVLVVVTIAFFLKITVFTYVQGSKVTTILGDEPLDVH